MPLHVQVKKPFPISSVMKSGAEFFTHFDPTGKLSDDEVVELAKRAGYDAVHAIKEGELNIFNPKALKSAIGNRGTYDTSNPDLNKATGGSVGFTDNTDAMRMELDQHYGVGGAVKEGVEAAAKKFAEMTAKSAPETIKASEALGKIEGRPLVITQADRTKVGGKWLGGPGFSSLQLQEGPHKAAEAVWGVKAPGVAKMILGGAERAGEKPVFTTMLGSPTQHQSNEMVFNELHRLFKKSAKEGNLTPELHQLINQRLAAALDKKNQNVFPSDIDILDPNFRKIANTFDRRAIAGHLMGGVTVGGKKGQIIDYDKVIRHTTDPALLESPTGALGNRLFTLSGGVINRPDLHPAFPTILQGEDLGVAFTPVMRDMIMKDFIAKTMQEKGRAPGVMDYTRGYPPSQLITEELLTDLQKAGYKKGGAVTASGLIEVKRKKRK
jgi:hypothetical protein